ncbi:MAG: nucleotidyltransferase domain-containing protein [Candidatus Parvarchaeota archaeon]|nr:nucleotidyltransferase domain-containing protein [Candidatus Jingweiarchaeum tengchongense]
MDKWKQMMIKAETHDILKAAKQSLSESENRHFSFSDVIITLIGKRLLFSISNPAVRDYIKEYSNELMKDERVLGMILFGSIAEGTWDNYSDIDLFIITKGKPLDIIHKTNEIDKKLKAQQEKLLDMGLGLYVSPFVVSVDELDEFRPIYLDIVDKGIVLYERQKTVSNFIRDLRSKISYKRIKTLNGEVLKWKEKPRPMH